MQYCISISPIILSPTTLSAAMHSRSASYEAIMTFLHEIEHFAMDAWHLPETEPPGLSSVKRREAVFRVACADQLVLDSKLCRAPDDLVGYFNRALHAVQNCLIGGSEEGIPTNARPYIETMLRWVKKRPFLTAKGYVGLAPG